MFIPPAIASELARQHHHDLLAHADRYRLSHPGNHPSAVSRWALLRASLPWWLRRSVAPMFGHSDLDDQASLGISERGGMAGDREPHRSHVPTAAKY